MNNKIIEDLVELGVYTSKSLQKEEFEELSAINTDNSLLYITGSYNDDYDNENNRYYKEIDTKGLSIEEVRLQLDIERTKNIKSIKSMVTFFVILTVIALICIVFGGNVDILNFSKFMMWILYLHLNRWGISDTLPFYIYSRGCMVFILLKYCRGKFLSQCVKEPTMGIYRKTYTFYSFYHPDILYPAKPIGIKHNKTYQ